MSRESSAQPIVDLFAGYAQEVRELMPEATWANRIYTLAVRVLNGTFGADWTNLHVLGDSDPSNFFRSRAAAAGDESFHRARVADLAETLANLQKVPGLKGVLEEMKRGLVEDRFAELEVGKILALAGIRFRYVEPGGPRGTSYSSSTKRPS